MTNQEKGFIIALGGIALGVVSKILLDSSGYDLHNYINGESLFDLKNMSRQDITERLKLAVKEERYSDAAEFKKILESKNTIQIS